MNPRTCNDSWLYAATRYDDAAPIAVTRNCGQLRLASTFVAAATLTRNGLRTLAGKAGVTAPPPTRRAPVVPPPPALLIERSYGIRPPAGSRSGAFTGECRQGFAFRYFALGSGRRWAASGCRSGQGLSRGRCGWLSSVRLGARCARGRRGAQDQRETDGGYGDHEQRRRDVRREAEGVWLGVVAGGPGGAWPESGGAQREPERGGQEGTHGHAEAIGDWASEQTHEGGPAHRDPEQEQDRGVQFGVGWPGGVLHVFAGEHHGVEQHRSDDRDHRGDHQQAPAGLGASAPGFPHHDGCGRRPWGGRLWRARGSGRRDVGRLSFLHGRDYYTSDGFVRSSHRWATL